MIKSILNGILNFCQAIINIVLTPVNLLFDNLFPDMSAAISTFNSFVQNYFGSSLAYFFSILPPIFRNLLVIWFTFVISYYGIIYTYIGIMKIWNIIKKIKIW